MRFVRDGAPREVEGSQTAFIDVIFQLVLFFVFSLAFAADERHLKTWLPKEGSGPAELDVISREVVLELARRDRETRCSIAEGFADGGEAPFEDYVIPQSRGVPDPSRIEACLRARKRRLESLGLGAPSLTVRFDPEVPWQDIVSVVDASIRAGIEDVALGAREAER